MTDIKKEAKPLMTDKKCTPLLMTNACISKISGFLMSGTLKKPDFSLVYGFQFHASFHFQRFSPVLPRDHTFVFHFHAKRCSPRRSSLPPFTLIRRSPSLSFNHRRSQLSLSFTQRNNQQSSFYFLLSRFLWDLWFFFCFFVNG